VQVQRQLEGKNGTIFIDALNDFHLLYFLSASESFDTGVFDNIIQAILDPSSIDIPGFRNSVATQLEKHLSQNTRPQAAPSGPSRPQPDLGIKSELMNVLLTMGYSESQATEALFATGGNSIEAAVNYLLSSM